MRIALINLSTRNDHAFLNLGALYIAAAIREGGHVLKFIDLVRFPMEDSIIIDNINEFQPDIIAFSGIVTTYYQLEHLSNIFKKTFANIPQLLGGSLGVSALKTVESFTGIDFICTGEGEETVIKMLEAFGGNKEWDGVPNIYYRQEGLFRPSPIQSAYLENLDSIPLPAYDIVDIEFYIDYTTRVFGKELAEGVEIPRVLPMVLSRGCPFSCSFCYRLIRKWRHNSTENIISHMKYLKERFNIGGIVLNDELVFVDRKWFVSLCESISASGLGLKFSCGGGKSNLVNKDVISAMKNAGFIRIGYGTESGSPKILKLMRKEVTVEDNRRALELTLKYGLISRTNFVFGHFGENKETVQETLGFINDLYKLQESFAILEDDLQVWFATAYPGSPLYEYAFRKGSIKDERGYLLKITSQDRYFLNLSDFKSAAQLRNFVYRGLVMLDIKKFWRRKKYIELLTGLRRLAFLYVIYFATFGRHAKLSDLLETLNLIPSAKKKALDSLRSKRQNAETNKNLISAILIWCYIILRI